MEVQKKLSILLLNIWLARSYFVDEKAEMTKFHVNAQIQLRYAITDVEAEIRNLNRNTKEVFFDMFIPKEAFVSKFSMVINDKTYEANVETKENAEKIYKNSTSTSGLLQSNSLPEFTDGKKVRKNTHHTLISYTVSASIECHSWLQHHLE